MIDDVNPGTNLNVRPVCPDDLNQLVLGDRYLRCLECGRSFPLQDGIFELLPRESSHVSSAENAQISAYQASFSKASDTALRGTLSKYVNILGNGYLYSWVARTIENIAGRERLVLLDAACGDGILSRYIAKRHSYTGIDFSHRPLARALRRNPGTYFRADLTHLPFESATFDLVVSCQALQYLRQPEVAVSQMARVLKPGGKLLLTVPNSESVKYRFQGISPIQLQRFGPESVRRLFDAQFDILSAKTQGLWLPLPKVSLHVPGNYPTRWGLSWTVLAGLRD